MIDFKPEKWTVKTETGHKYTALGYERRGIWNVPIADFLGEIPIQCGVYEILHGFVPKDRNRFISVTEPSYVERVMLEEAGYFYDGCFANYRG